MRKRYVGYAAGLICACLLYFFENNPGTRIVLACTLLLPFFPMLRRGLLERDEAHRKPEALRQTRNTFFFREEDEPGDVRAYRPGDPVNRIHWKLSAKREELLVRPQAGDRIAEETKSQGILETEQPAAGSARKRVLRIGLLIFLCSLILLFVLPSANQGMKALLNRLFDASEAVNAYAYDRFAVSPDQSVALAAVLLSVLGLCLLGMILLSRSRLPALAGMACVALFQIYFGLAFPALVNVPLFALFVLWVMKRPPDRRTILCLIAILLAVSGIVLLIWPGVDAATESASEAVRDRLSRIAQSVTGASRELPAGEKEVRPVYTQSLTAGSREAQPDREYRLETVEEEQIAMPQWFSLLRVLLPLLLSVALVTLPFVPFFLLNQRQKKALEARKAFASENVREAVFAIFQHVTAWLEATGHGEDNVPYAAWSADLAPGYAERYADCEKLFEEAAYSTHEMREEQRQQALALLNETETTLRQRADWKQRLRLKYKECLWG